MQHERTNRTNTGAANSGAAEASQSEQRGADLLFSLGQVVATPAALEALEAADLSAAHFLRLHQTGNWGELDEHDRRRNDRALTAGCRLLSTYRLPKTGRRIWVITEADRSATTVLLQGEY